MLYVEHLLVFIVTTRKGSTSTSDSDSSPSTGQGASLLSLTRLVVPLFSFALRLLIGLLSFGGVGKAEEATRLLFCEKAFVRSAKARRGDVEGVASMVVRNQMMNVLFVQLCC